MGSSFSLRCGSGSDFYIDVDPDATFYLDADLDTTFIKRIRIYGLSNHGSVVSRDGSRVSLRGSNADPDQVFHFGVDLDLAFYFDADGSASTLLTSMLIRLPYMIQILADAGLQYCF
jgi:hypothetical protein